MQYIKLKYQTDEVDLFSDDDMDGDIQPIPCLLYTSFATAFSFTICKNRNNQYSSGTFLLKISSVAMTVTIATKITCIMDS